MGMPNRMEHRLPMQGCQENMRLVPENRMSERRLQSVQNQQSGQAFQNQQTQYQDLSLIHI